MNLDRHRVRNWSGLQFFLMCATCLCVTAVKAGTVTYIYTDHQNTPLAESDENGNIVALYDYRPYGVLALGQSPSGPGYAGHISDKDTGLSYMQARYYDSGVGRFISADPKAIRDGSLAKFNRFSYANNSPVTYFDPNGMDTEISMMFHSSSVFLGLGYNHEFVAMRDTNSHQVIVARAGPSGDYSVSPSAGVSNSESHDDGKVVTLQATVAPLEKSQEAGASNKTLQGSVVVVPQSLKEVVSSAQKIANKVNDANIPYRAQTTNSNAFANTVYQSLTGKVPPQQDLATGSDTKLPISQAPDKSLQLDSQDGVK